MLDELARAICIRHLLTETTTPGSLSSGVAQTMYEQSRLIYNSSITNSTTTNSCRKPPAERWCTWKWI